MNTTKISLKNSGITSSQNTFKSSSPVTESQPKNQIPLLNGIRAVACIIVFSIHLNGIARQYYIWPPLPKSGKPNAFFVLNAYLGDYFGASGVYLFFLLSSFLLFLPYAKALLFDGPWPSWRRFYLRRIFRILPGYYAALLLMVLFFHPEFLHFKHWHDLWIFLTFRMSYQLSGKLNIVFWTLAVEFQFYLLMPIFAWLFRPIVCRGTVSQHMAKLTLCLLALTAWGLLTKFWGQFIADTPKLDFLIPHTISTTLKSFIYGDRGGYLEVFAVGMFMCMLYTYMQNSSLAERWNTRMRRSSSIMFTIGLLLLTFLSLGNFYFLSRATHGRAFHITIKASFDLYAPTLYSCWLQWEALAYAIGYGLCFWALLYGPAKLKRPFESSLLDRIASISFSLYLWQLPLLNIFTHEINPALRKTGGSSLAQYTSFWCWTLVIIIPVSMMLYQWIEQPGMRLGEWLIRKLES